MATILVVDDEPHILDLLRGYLERDGYKVHVAGHGEAGLQLARDLSPDLVILDVMLPGLDGIEVCRQLRQFSDAYVLMLTARAEEIDRVVGLEVGADDYVTKPFSPREVVARVRAMLRRPRHQANSLANGEHGAQHLGDLVIDRDRHRVTRNEKEVPLTAREFELLTMLADQPGRVFTRAQILDHIWSSEFYDEHVVEVHVANLRHKLGDDSSAPRYVETVRGAGYRAAARE